ncbi:MAG: heparinase II/III family protein [Myxococcales bacterium]|nr:heparinase II/III family protein [Myxococcales bacterium]
MLVDAGVGTYARGPDRAYARATRAHNTVTVGLRPGDQHELWASHRIGAARAARRGAGRRGTRCAAACSA